MKLTRAEKNAIRMMPCGKCGATPPFSDGSRCHPHRIEPSRGYVAGNVVPRCPVCHSREPGHSTFVASAFHAGKAGGPKGGKRVHQVHPTMASENGKKNMAAVNARLTHEDHKRLGRQGWEKWRKMYPDLARQNGFLYGPKGGSAKGPTKSEGNRKRWQNMSMEQRAACIRRGWETRRAKRAAA